MTDVLTRIVARKRCEVEARFGTDPAPGAQPTPRSLRKALSRPGARFIMEVKPRSPSGHVAKNQPLEALAAYRHSADAISVLTDEPDFGGSLALLSQVRHNYGGPILAKDFIVDARQVTEARSHGADAVLCMMSVLDDEGAKAVLDEAGQLAMDVIVEVHDERQLDRALALGARIIGINNRDLKTLRTDLSVTERLSTKIPDEILVISESGISRREDVARLAPLVDGFLVGSALMASEDISFDARYLVHGATKVCGLTRVSDVALAARFGATHAGFIFVPGTPRAVDLDRARTLVSTARDFGLRTVGVFKDMDAKEIAAIVNPLGLQVIQYHGQTRDREASLIRSRVRASTELWGLCAVTCKGLSEAPLYADRTLFDTKGAGGLGGTGRTFDWELLKTQRTLGESFLAGGIGPGNAREASQVGAFGLDVCSGIEGVPGSKDSMKIEALFAELRPLCRGEA